MSLVSSATNLKTAYSAMTQAGQNAMRPDGSAITDTKIQNNGLSGHSVISRRVTDDFKHQKTIGAASTYGASAANFEYNSRLGLLLGQTGGPDDDKTNTLYNTLREFVGSFDASSIPSAERRAGVLSTALNFASQVTNYTVGLQDVKSTLESDISKAAATINEILSDLVSVNKTLGGGGRGVGSIEDQRDALLSQLGEYMAIQYSFNDSGMVTVRSRGSADASRTLVDSFGYVQISYTSDLDLFSHNDYSDTITITSYNLNNESKSIARVQVSDVISKFGGRFSGLLNVRDNVLPKALSNINNTARQLAEKVNELQNSGSGYPPAAQLTSEHAMLLSDKAAFKGKAHFAVTDKDGKALTDAAGNYIKPVTVDFDNLYSRNSISKQFTVQDVVDEINQVAAGYSKASVGLGRVASPVGTTQWLVDQVRLVPTSDISDDGAMSFQLELNSGSAFDTKFQVTGMTVLNAANAVLVQPTAFVAPDIITLSSGQNSKTGQNIVAHFTPGETHSIVRLKMLVIGANGVCDEKWVDFTIGDGINNLDGSQIMNQRAEAVAANNAVGGGLGATISVTAGGAAAAATATAAKLGAPIVRADFVDANGLTVTDVNTEGYLQISAVVGSGVVIDSANSAVLSTGATATEIPKNLSHWYGLNNFFTSDIVNPASNLTVRSDIAANAGLISLGKAQEFTNGAQSIMKGQVLPSATLDLTGVLPADGNTVTIGGVSFTFRNAPAAATDILIVAGDIPATIQTLYNAVKANATLTNLVTFTAPTAGDTKLNVVAKTAGANVPVASTGAIANVWKHPANGIGGAVGPITTQLTGGYAGAVYDLSGGNAAVNNTVTINGVLFTFVDGAPTANQVQRNGAGGASDTITNLKAALEASTDIRIKGLFTFTIDPAHTDQLIVYASHAGSSGNALTTATSVVTRWKCPGNVAIPFTPGTQPLIGGVDIQSTAAVNTHALQIGVDTNNVFTNLSTKSLKFDLSTSVSMQSIDDFFNSSFQTKMDHMFSASERQSLLDAGVYEQLQIEFDHATKLSNDTREAAYMTFTEFQQYYQMCTSLVQQIIEARNYLLRTIG